MPAALGGAPSISYTARLELATVVPRALARCRFSKSHHRRARVAVIGPCRSRTTGQRRRAREARAASAVAPCRFSTAYFVEIGNFAPFAAFLHIKGRNFPNVFIRSRVHMTAMNCEKFRGNRSARFSKIRKTDTQSTQTDRRGSFIYIEDGVDAAAGVRFLVSFLVDARGAVMFGRRHSGLRFIIPPLATSCPVQVQCKLVSEFKLASPPPLCEADALMARVLDFGPTRLKFDTLVQALSIMSVCLSVCLSQQCIRYTLHS